MTYIYNIDNCIPRIDKHIETVVSNIIYVKYTILKSTYAISLPTQYKAAHFMTYKLKICPLQRVVIYLRPTGDHPAQTYSKTTKHVYYK